MRKKTKNIAPFGQWKSPVTSELVSSQSIYLSEVVLQQGDIFWLESRPHEDGRTVIMKRSFNGEISNITPKSFNARTRVHELGGGSYLTVDKKVYFSNFEDQRVYVQDFTSEPYAISPKGDYRFADGVYDKERRRIIYVLEEHHVNKSIVHNSLVSLNTEIERPFTTLIQGYDFYSSPRLSPDGSKLAWLCWNHPNMPWISTELWVADLEIDGTIIQASCVAGGNNESIFQPEWSPDGTLYFISDRTGWWNIFRLSDSHAESVVSMKAEFGVPQWHFGLSTYAFESETRIIASFTEHGKWYLATIDILKNKIDVCKTNYTDIEYIKASYGKAVFIAASPTENNKIVELNLASGEIEVLYAPCSCSVPQEYLTLPQSIEFNTGQGDTAHAFYYQPRNDDFLSPEGSRPPLLVMSHGGPTYTAKTKLNLNIQYWTSRGFAVLDINYRGSSGYGRSYRNRIKGQWGIVDVEDCINGARYLVEKGEVDGDRLVIRGGSAGGFTTLSTLTFHDVFKTGGSYFGVSDLVSFSKETHKFESHYLEWLIGKYSECHDTFFKRSPINYIEQLSCPIIFFQGSEDTIVLPSQTETIYFELLKKGVPVEYLCFEGEHHGFRRSENIRCALDAELSFYSKILILN